MRFVRATATLLLVLVAACSGGAEGAGKFVPATPTAASNADRGSQKTVPAGRLGPEPAPARLFAGTASAAGQLTRYCKNSTCQESDPRTPAYLNAPSSSFTLFTVADVPLEAHVEVRVRPSEHPSTVTLEPGSLMVFNHGLGVGRYLIDLIVRWSSSEARWRFGLNIVR